MKITKKLDGFTPTPFLASLLCFFKNNYFTRLFSNKNRFFNNHDVKQQNTTPGMVWGFTLVEIVVVIGIMAVLTAIVYSSFDTSKKQSRDQQRVSDISAIQLSLELYFNKHGVYPQQLNELVPVYISSIPNPPSSYSDYNYVPLTRDGANCISYQLWTKFETSNSYLNSKKGFNSKSLPSGTNTCVGSLPITDASSDALIYDVMP